MIRRGDIWWADVDRSSDSESRRPVLVVSADAFNRSRLPSVVAVAVSSDARLVDAPGNVALPTRSSGLPTDAVVNVAEIVTLSKDDLDEWVMRVTSAVIRQVESGIRLALDLTP